MSLKNLLKIGQLLEHETDAAEVQRLLRAARRALQDAMNDSIGAETRFDAAYRAIMQSATVALHVNGYRASTSVPGHHRTIIQSLPLTIDADAVRIAVLDRLRHKRNVIDYSGGEIDDTSVAACIEEATRLVDDVEDWLVARHPGLLKQHT